MVDQSVVDYIINGLSRGYTPQDLRNALLRQGWRDYDINQAFQAAYQRGAPQHGFATSTDHMGFFTKMKMILTSPSEFFQAAKSDHLGDALKYYAIVLLIPMIIGLVIAFVAPMMLISAFSPDLASIGGAAGGGALLAMFMEMFMGLLIIMIIAAYIGSLMGTFITAGIYHIIAMIFGARKSYSETYKAFTYASTPFLIIGWVSILLILVHFYAYIGAAIIIAVWSLIVLIKGLSKLQEISGKRAAAIVLLPVIVVGVLVAALFMLTPMTGTGTFTPDQIKGICLVKAQSACSSTGSLPSTWNTITVNSQSCSSVLPNCQCLGRALSGCT